MGPKPATSQIWVAPDWSPKSVTDDSIVPIILTDVIPSSDTEHETKAGKTEKLLHKLKGDSTSIEESNKAITKVVFMPDRDRKKWFAKDDEGKYVGTEPYRQWHESELDEKWGQNRPETFKDPKRGPGYALGNEGWGAY